MGESIKPDPKTTVQGIVQFPLRGPIRDRIFHPEGIEGSKGPFHPPTDPELRRQYEELIRDARRGGPPGRY